MISRCLAGVLYHLLSVFTQQIISTDNKNRHQIFCELVPRQSTIRFAN